MRRKDREITSLEEQFKIWKACKVCRVAMVDGDRPYVLPLNYGAALEEEKITLYLHGAKAGRKLDVLRRNPRVCVEADCEHRLVEAEDPCGYGYAFASVLGEGTAELLEEPAEKAHGLSVLMSHQTGKEFFFTAAQTVSVSVLRVCLENTTGKRRS